MFIALLAGETHQSLTVKLVLAANVSLRLALHHERPCGYCTVEI
jgi:hypothetical protein